MADPSKLCKGEGARILIVEGVNDCHVVFALCQAHNVPETFSVSAGNSDNQALDQFNALVSTSGQESIGLILDADKKGVIHRWGSVIGKLSRYKDSYQFPVEPSLSGTIIPAKSLNKPRIGFWFMPNNKDYGMLEDLCLEMADPNGRKVAEEAVTIAENQGVACFKDVHRSKAVVHTYLAWQEKPGSPLGQAIAFKYLDAGQEEARALADWLRELFADPVLAKG